jgi:HD-like signal output (HDOD) protein
MITLIIMIQNEREEQILKAAFEQRGVKVVLSKPTYQNYVMILQYIPDIVFMELPHICTEQLAFARRLRAYKRTKTIPIAGYGSKIDEMVKNGISQSGFTLYIERPLKFSMLLKVFAQLLKNHGKTFAAPAEPSDREKDLELIINSDALPMQKLEAMIRHISSLLAFPFTVAKVLQISQSEKSGASNLAQAMSSDPSITTHILKVANSVFFASSNHRISSIKDAIVRIGFNETRKIVMGMHIMQLFKGESRSSGFDRVDFRYHSLIVGLLSERFAKLVGDIYVDTAFLTGLLHDLGIILLDEFLSPVFGRALEATAASGGHFIDSQTELFNVNHNDLIGSLFPLWKIPQDITDAITFQFKIEEFNGAFNTPGKKLAVCIALASQIAKTVHIGRECDEFVYPISDTVLKYAKLKTGISKSFIENLNADLAMYQNFLGLESRTFVSEIAGVEEPSNHTIALFTPEPFVFIPVEVHLRNMGFKIRNVKTLFDKEDVFCCFIIYDVTGKMTFSSEKIIDGSDEVYGGPPDMSKKIILIGQSREAPEGLPRNFNYLGPKYDLRMVDEILGKILTEKADSNASTTVSEADLGDEKFAESDVLNV